MPDEERQITIPADKISVAEGTFENVVLVGQEVVGTTKFGAYYLVRAMNDGQETFRATTLKWSNGSYMTVQGLEPGSAVNFTFRSTSELSRACTTNDKTSIASTSITLCTSKQFFLVLSVAFK